MPEPRGEVATFISTHSNFRYLRHTKGNIEITTVSIRMDSWSAAAAFFLYTSLLGSQI